MAKMLDVYFYKKVVGQLIQDDDGDLCFSYLRTWLDDPAAVKISCSLPLQGEVFGRKACHAFFGGILPEENQRKIIAKNLGISANNDFSMLEKIGGECAGALSFIPSNEKLNLQDDSYHQLTETELYNILQSLPSRPLLAGEQGVRLSLAGVQDKLAVYVEGEKVAIPLNSAPSTHIIKPDFSTFEGVIFNEAFCLNLARKIGLLAVEAEIRKVKDIDCLLIKRYDRYFIHAEKNPIQICRIHQEDFCQALSIFSTNKYQNEGGPSLKQCFDLLRRESSIPAIDLERMISAVIFNFLIGNCDAHGKNFSLLYHDKLQLAPLYDLICTAYYHDLDNKMAMKLGGEYKINHISMKNFDKLADDVQLAKPEVRKRIHDLIKLILSSLSSIEIQHEVQQGVADIIKNRCNDFIKFNVF